MTKKQILLLLSLNLFILSLISVLPAMAAADNAIEVFFNDPTASQRDRTLQDMILDGISDAQERIYVATYNFTDTKTADALKDAVRDGLEVRLVIHYENADSDVVRSLEKAGVKVVVSDSNGLMHSKFIVIDQDLTISGSANMTPGSFFYDNNYMIRIVSSDVNALFRDEFNEMFLDKKFGSASPRSEPAPILTLDDGTRVLVRFSPEDGIEESLLSLIEASKESIYVLAYSFASDDLGQALIDRYDDGLDVIVVFEDEKAFTDGGGEAINLRQAGVPIFMDGCDDCLMHQKVFIFDKSVVSAGSYNFTRSAEIRNDEQVLIIQNEAIVNAFLEEFDKISPV